MTDKIVIRSITNNGVLYETTATDLRAAVVEAVGKGANLSRANLSRAYLSGADLSRANLSRAYLSGADLSGADLSRADLSGADLSGADLSGADLSRANLSRANLSRANLSGADLSGAENVSPWLVTPLLMLLDQPGPLRAYKLVDASLQSPMQPTGKIAYSIGGEFSVADANTSVTDDCGAGINLATWDWIAKEWQEGYRVLVAEFTATDIAAIPTGAAGKFRVHRCTIVSEITDLQARGINLPALPRDKE